VPAPDTNPDVSALAAAPGVEEWYLDLQAEGARGEAAVAHLHGLLLRAAHFEVFRRRGSLPQLSAVELDELAQDAADDAAVSVLRRLDDFRGESSFRTWAYKFALLEAAVAMRRRGWQGREIPLEPEVWPLLADKAGGPAQAAEQRELLEAVQRGIATALTPHQREVLVAVALNDVPIDVLAERLSTTRGALYKTVHYARRRLRAYLESQ
jgi:RNA polymerase sigma-70 factor, ECF subfamily